MSLLFFEIQINVLLRAKVVVIFDTGHHLMSHSTDINFQIKIIKNVIVSKSLNFVVKITLLQKLQNITDINLCNKVNVKRIMHDQLKKKEKSLFINASIFISITENSKCK